MIKQLKANKAVKKASVFAAVFVLTGVLMGSMLMGFSETNAVPASGEAYYNEFVALVQASNNTSGEVSTDTVPSAQSLNVTVDGEDNYSLNLGPSADAVPTAGAQDLMARPQVQEQPEGQAGFVYQSDIPLSAELQEFTYDRCQELGLEYELVLAVMWRESRFKVDAVGYNTNGTRDSGIMQINDVNRNWLRDNHNITDLMDPYQNITAGTMMLAEYFDNYGDEGAALMAYHYGKAGAQRKMAQGITTNHQVKVALEQRDFYRGMFENV